MLLVVEAARAKIFAPFSAFGSRLRRKLHLKKGSRANDTVTNSSKWHLPE